MAIIRDSVIDQYGNAAPAVQVTLFRDSDGFQIAQVNTDANGYFEFSGLPNDTYRLQIVGAGVTTRIIRPIAALDPYPLATQTNAGLMSSTDKTKLDNYPTTFSLDSMTDVEYTPAPSGGAYLSYNGSGFWYPILPGSMPFPLKDDFIQTGGGLPTAANKYVKLNGLGLIDYGFLEPTPIGGSAYAGQLVVLNMLGQVDASMYDAATVGGIGSENKLAQLNSAGLLNISLLDTVTIGGASSAGKLPLLNTSGRLDPSMLPTTGGTFKGSLDLTVAYVDPLWDDGDYGASSSAGAIDSSWLPHLNAPVPSVMKVGDNIYFTGGKYSVVPSSVDLDAYLPRDGSRPMVGQLSLIDQSAAPPTGVQAVSRAFADRAYQPAQLGALPAVTQATNKSTSVAINAIMGKITMHNASLPQAVMAGIRPVKFAMSNNKILVDSVVTVNVIGGGTPGAYRAWVGEVSAGGCNVYVENLTSAPLAQPVILLFNVAIGGL
jgi:hypothetical protein